MIQDFNKFHSATVWITDQSLKCRPPENGDDQERVDQVGVQELLEETKDDLVKKKKKKAQDTTNLTVESGESSNPLHFTFRAINLLSKDAGLLRNEH